MASDLTQQASWQQFCTWIASEILDQPQAGMHRDFHSRNLMLQHNRLAVIDFQDAVLGPVTYDVVSLLKDCYYQLPQAQYQQFLQLAQQILAAEGELGPLQDFATFKRKVDLTGLQRHIKAIGIFRRLQLRDGKLHYLSAIPLTWKYILEVCQSYPEAEPMLSLLQSMQAEMVQHGLL